MWPIRSSCHPVARPRCYLLLSLSRKVISIVHIQKCYLFYSRYRVRATFGGLLNPAGGEAYGATGCASFERKALMTEGNLCLKQGMLKC